MSPQTLDMVKDMVARLVDEFHPWRIYLFGSQARGAAGPQSDVDLMVIVDDLTESPTRMARRAYRALRHRKVPLDILFRASDAFRARAADPSTLENQVEREGILLHG
ncbi:MAG: nucleotidyltransferase domain-containing protein [Planctomycetes bacterium]|jgi:predicted nucleotidyltransferase|nr:nucleotidyltransferase domain-containing protein [Planctomycetota bacterium]